VIITFSFKIVLYAKNIYLFCHQILQANLLVITQLAIYGFYAQLEIFSVLSLVITFIGIIFILNVIKKMQICKSGQTYFILLKVDSRRDIFFVPFDCL